MWKIGVNIKELQSGVDYLTAWGLGFRVEGLGFICCSPPRPWRCRQTFCRLPVARERASCLHQLCFTFEVSDGKPLEHRWAEKSFGPLDPERYLKVHGEG